MNGKAAIEVCIAATEIQCERPKKPPPPPPTRVTDCALPPHRSKILALGAAVGHVPRMSMGRARWGAMPGDALAGAGEAALAGVRQLTPEAREVATRTYVAGGRGWGVARTGLASVMFWRQKAGEGVL
jgi:hypothetical protein